MTYRYVANQPFKTYTMIQTRNELPSDPFKFAEAVGFIPINVYNTANWVRGLIDIRSKAYYKMLTKHTRTMNEEYAACQKRQ